MIGHSVRGRPIDAVELGDPDASVRILVVGCIHGDEQAGRAVVSRLMSASPSGELDLWLIDDLNPDGVVAGTRQNADGVDLNRNFPLGWRAIGRRGDQQYAGTAPLSEPESRAVAALILRIRPALTVWFHQPVGVVDESGGDLAVERRLAAGMQLPLRRLTRYPGSAASWQNQLFVGTSAVVIELPRHVSQRLVGRAAAAVLTAVRLRDRD